jgi:hypothetical protein
MTAKREPQPPTWAEDDKGERDERVKLPPVIVEHLRRLPSFDPVVFLWNRSTRQLCDEFRHLQEAAGVLLPCRKSHKHTPYCYVIALPKASWRVIGGLS